MGREEYLHLDPDERSRELADSLHLLELARIWHRVRHSAGNGVPLWAEAKERPELFYWHREQKSSGAEVDYLITHGDRIVPVEVKAGATGSLKSLQLFRNREENAGCPALQCHAALSRPPGNSHRRQDKATVSAALTAPLPGLQSRRLLAAANDF